MYSYVQYLLPHGGGGGGVIDINCISLCRYFVAVIAITVVCFNLQMQT